MSEKDMKFAFRETVELRDRAAIFELSRRQGGALSKTRCDVDGGEVTEFQLGTGHKKVMIQWFHWLPSERPILCVASNSAKALAGVLALIVFSESFYSSTATTSPGEVK